MKVYAADNPVRIGGMVFHPAHFTCKATGTKLTLKTAVIGEEDGAKDVYLRGKEPVLKPKQVVDVITERVSQVPDSNMRTSDRVFNIANNGGVRGAAGSTNAGSQYGVGAVLVSTQQAAPKPPTTVNNVNLQEKLHNGPGYTNATDAPATD